MLSQFIKIAFALTFLLYLPVSNSFAITDTATQSVENSQRDAIAEKLTQSLGFLPNYPDSSLMFIEELLLSELVQQDDSLYAVAKYVAGTAYYFKDYYNLAVENYEDALNTNYSQQDENFRVRLLNNLGVFHDNLLQHDEALRYYQLALEIEERRGDPGELADVFINIGLVYHSIGDVDEALNNFFKAGSLIEGLPLSFRHGLVQQNLGIAYQTTGRYDESVEATQHAISIFEELTIYRSELQSRHNLVDVYINTGELDKAYNLALENIEKADEYGIPVQKALIITHLARIELLKGNAQSSISYLNEADEIFNSLTDPYETYPLSILEIKMEAYAMLGDSENAMTVFREYRELREERDLARQATAINELNLQLDVKENMARLQEQAAELSLQRAILKIVVVFSIVLLAALIAMGVFYIKKNRVYRLLEEKKRELEKVNIEKDKLLSILAHDIRAPLSSLQGIVFLIQEGITEGVDLKKTVNDIEYQLHQSITMLSNYLQWAQNQKNGIQTTLENIELKKVSENIVDEIKASADKKGVSINLDIPENLVVKADKNLMQVILRNLISNAIKYEKSGSIIKISAQLENQKVLLNIKDHGVGIPEEKQESLFDPFSKTSIGTLGETGTGLGLSICKEFAEKQGGTVYLKESSKKGTTFIVELNKA